MRDPQEDYEVQVQIDGALAFAARFLRETGPPVFA